MVVVPRCLVVSLLLGFLVGCGGEAADPVASVREAAPPAFEDAQRAEAKRTGFPVEVSNALGMRFRLIPASQFPMGEPVSCEPPREDDEPHAVRFVTPYYLQVGPVTNAQFRRFRPTHDSGTDEDGRSLNGDARPVRRVSYDDAVAFATWLREQDTTWRYRLPTEAEWEYVARGAVAAIEGADAAGAGNGWGIEHVGGPLAEWCHDRFGPYPTWPQDNPQGATFGDARVVRGGSLPETRDRPICGRAARSPDATSSAVTFRLAFGLGYARHDYGAHAVTFRTVDPTAEGSDAFLRPGYAMFMISIPDRLTDRQNDPNARPFWTAVPDASPTVVKLWPGRYYVYCHRTKDGVWARGLEVKFDVPGRTTIDVPVPREDQVSPQ